jgi:hypothetical protein
VGGGIYVAGCEALLNKPYQYFDTELLHTYRTSGTCIPQNPNPEPIPSFPDLTIYFEWQKLENQALADKQDLIDDAIYSCSSSLQGAIDAQSNTMVPTPAGQCCVPVPGR